MPSALLERPDPLPRMKHTPTTSETADLLARLTDLATPTSRGKPVDPVVQQPGGAPAEPTTAAQRLSQPSLAFMGGKYQPDNAPGDAAFGPMVSVGPPRVSLNRSEVEFKRSMPEIYRLRTAPDRARLAQRHGATSETESAVRAGLKWLADNQEADGRWSPRRHEAGREAKVAGRDRRGAGIQADTGMTGLALFGLPRLGSHPSTRTVSRHCPARLGLPDPNARSRRVALRQSKSLLRHVLPCDGRFRHERGLRHDRRTAVGRARASSGRVYDRRPGPRWRRVALLRPRPRRHEPTGLAVDGPKERGAGRYSDSKHHRDRGACGS